MITNQALTNSTYQTIQQPQPAETVKGGQQRPQQPVYSSQQLAHLQNFVAKFREFIITNIGPKFEQISKMSQKDPILERQLADLAASLPGKYCICAYIRQKYHSSYS
jgi:hypothetical protein